MKYIIVFFIIFAVIIIGCNFIYDWIYYNGDEAFEKTQLKKDIKAAKIPLILLICSIYFLIASWTNMSIIFLIIGCVLLVLSGYLYLFNKSVQSAIYLKHAIKYGKKKDTKNMLKCAKLSVKFKLNTTAEYILENKDMECIE